MLNPVSVSVLLASKNPDLKKLSTAVESVLSQTLPDLELIIIDDGSNEASALEIEKMKAVDHRIKVIHNPKNLGLAASLNVGLKMSHGRYIARMDDDDISQPERLQKQISFLNAHQEFGFVGSIAQTYGITENDGMFFVPEQPTMHDFLWNSPYIHPTVLFRSTAIRKVDGYRVARETRRAEDYDLFLRLFLVNITGANIQEPLLKYFIDIDSMKKKRLYKYRIDEFKLRKKYFAAMGAPWYRFVFELKPLIVGLLPQSFIYFLHQRKHS